MPHEFFGGPFGLVITRGRIGPGAQGAHVDESPDLGLLCRRHEVPRATCMDVLKCALANLSDNAHEMDNGLHPVDRPVQRGHIQYVAGMNFGPPA